MWAFSEEFEKQLVDKLSTSTTRNAIYKDFKEWLKLGGSYLTTR